MHIYANLQSAFVKISAFITDTMKKQNNVCKHWQEKKTEFRENTLSKGKVDYKMSNKKLWFWHITQQGTLLVKTMNKPSRP